MVKKIVKYLPIIVIVSAWLIFSSQYFIKGLAPFPGTYLLSNFDPWNDYDFYVGPVKNSATPDVITQIFPWKTVVIDSYKSGNFPLWNPYAFSGTPLLANYQSAALSPLNIFYFIFSFVDAWSISILLQPLLAMLFMFAFLKSIGRSGYASVVGAVGFGFCGFLVTWMTYGTLAYAILFLPLALFAIEKFFQTKKWAYSFLISLSVPLSIFSGHFQTSLYFLIFMFAYILFKLVTTREKRTFALSLLYVFLGLLLSAPQLLPSIEFYLNSPRANTYMITEIIPWQYIFTFIAPDFFGNPITRNDWFGHYAEWNAYIGLIPLSLALYGLRRKISFIYFFLLLGIISLISAFQSPVQDVLVSLKIPVLSTSAGSRIIVLFSFSFAVLSAFGFDNLSEDIKKGKWRIALIWIGILGAIFLAIWLIVYQGLIFPPDKLKIAFSNLRLPSIILISLIFSVCAAFIFRNKKVFHLFLLSIVFLVVFDMLRFSLKWMPFEKKEFVYPKIKLFDNLNRVAPQDRVMSSFGLEGAGGILKLSSTEGYDPLYIQSYGEFMAGSIEGKYRLPERSVVRFPKVTENNDKLLNFLGVKYVVHKKSDAQFGWAYPYWKETANHFSLIAEDDKFFIFENSRVFPRALIIGDYRVIKDPDSVIEEVYKKETDLSNEVILSKKPTLDIGKSEKSTADIIKYSPNLIKVETTADNNSIVVLTDPYYPGWRVTIDNKPGEILLANYAFRAVEVPKGTHVVNFIYSPGSVKLGFILSIIGIMSVLGLRVVFSKK